MFMEYTLSHEMFHSIHYADTMTVSGRWIYTRKDFYKQQAAKEALAEYFALAYSKQALPKVNGEIDVVEQIYHMRRKHVFPEDGGYSGALIIDKLDSKGNFAKNNRLYFDTYPKSLSDMPDAFYRILKQSKM